MPQALVAIAGLAVVAYLVRSLGQAAEDVGQGVDEAGSGALKIAAAVAAGYWLAKNVK